MMIILKLTLSVINDASVTVCSERPTDDAATAVDRPPAMSYREYLQKYYGDRARQSPKGDVSDADNETPYLSDGCIDYNLNHRLNTE